MSLPSPGLAGERPAAIGLQFGTPWRDRVSRGIGLPLSVFLIGVTISLPLTSAASRGWQDRPTTSPPNVGNGDFVPCTGYGTPPPGAEDQPGPWANRLLVAYSEDGLVWSRAHRILTDQGDVPDAIVDENGLLRVYYVTWCPPEVRNRIVVALSDDGAVTWTFRRVTIRGMVPGQPDAVDPDIVRTPDRKWRLYFTSAPPGLGAAPRTYSAISDDGFAFELEAGWRLHVEGRDVLDPSVLRVGDRWHLFAGGRVTQPRANWHATSPDGLSFSRESDFFADGIIMANGLAVEGGYRFYGFRQDLRVRDIRSLFTSDGEAWHIEPGVRLAPDRSHGLEAEWVKDPGVARLGDGRFVMIYVTTIPEFLASRRTPEPETSPTRPWRWFLQLPFVASARLAPATEPAVTIPVAPWERARSFR